MATKEAMEKLLHDWNMESPPVTENDFVEINDETLREGIQSPSASHPSVFDKLHILSILDRLGIDNSCVSFPAANERSRKDTETMLGYKITEGLKIGISCAARTLRRDIEPILDLSQKTGLAIGANIFVGSSPIRRLVEGWDRSFLLKQVHESVLLASENGLPVCFITEDTTRSDPDDLREIFLTAIDAGASRLCICDTVGESTPAGVSNIVRFVKEIIRESGREIAIDWHGHNDRGFGLINAMVAIREGASRIHATGLGLGERTGNTSIEQLLINLHLAGYRKFNIEKIPELSDTVARAFRISIPPNFPVVGNDAFRTATGVHASAILKARKRGSVELEDKIYSSVPAHSVGTTQKIEIGPMSGHSNVVAWLEDRGMELPEHLVDMILQKAKTSDRLLLEEEIIDLLESITESSSSGSTEKDNPLNDAVLLEFIKQKEKLKDFLKRRREVSIGTLGPRGTTSHEALNYFIGYIEREFCTTSPKTLLKNDFESLTQELKRGEVDMIIVPNAYENISSLYWDSNIDNLYSFLMRTPDYGLAAPGNLDLNGMKHPIKVSLCKPVYQLLDDKMTEVFGKDVKYEIVNAYSTVESVRVLLEGKADCVLTNEPSIRDKGLSFISSVKSSNVLWSVFCISEMKHERMDAPW